jgi:hypothetical protein
MNYHLNGHHSTWRSRRGETSPFHSFIRKDPQAGLPLFFPEIYCEYVHHSLALAALIAAPRLHPVDQRRAAPDSVKAGQGYEGGFHGYPLSEWYRQDGW